MDSFQPEGFSFDIFKSRYAFTENETWQEFAKRVATQISKAELPEKQKQYEELFEKIIVDNLLVPGGRICYGAGRTNPNLLNCFSLSDKLDSKEGWGNIAREMIITSMAGGGSGINFSDVRPRGSKIGNQKGECPGPVELMELINGCAAPIKAGGERRVALMFALDLHHPDIEEFLNAKLTLGKLTYANISVKCHDTSHFKKCVEKDLDYDLHWKGKVFKKIKARVLWNRIVENAWRSAEPGFLNWELAENESNIHYIEKLTVTNPCVVGETNILTDSGYKEIKDLVNQTVNIWNGFEWSEVVPRITGKNQEILNIKFSDGSELKCTKYHKFYIVNLDETVIIKAKDLCINDVLMSYKMPDGGIICNVSVVEITTSGIADKVYCFNEPKRHLGIFNGVITGQCGEIIMSSYDSCCLGHLVLPRFIINEEVNYNLLGDTIRTSVRFLDNVLNVNTYPLPEMQKKGSELRRIGLGTTGLADMLVLLNLKYGSIEGNKFIDKLYRFISKASYEASIMLAIEKGAFPLCDRKKHIESGFISRMPKKIKSLILEHGIRNCAIQTIAPTGTVSILSGNCSSGIEPMFAPAYERRFFEGDVRKTELVFHPLFSQYMNEGKSVEHFIGASELTVEQHLEVQKIIQNHIDNSVSKTINMPISYPIEDMSKMWLKYLPDLKGTTFYREGSRGFIEKDGSISEPPLVAISLDKAKQSFDKKAKTMIKVVNDCPTGVCNL